MKVSGGGKKAQVFREFSEGKNISELSHLGVDRHTLNKYRREWEKQGGGSTPPEKPPSGGKGNTDLNDKSFVTFRTTTFTVPLTTNMRLGYEAAINEWEIPKDTPFNDFIDAVLEIFFEDRGIKLGGYVVTEEPPKTKEEETPKEVGDGAENIPSTGAEQGQ